MKALLISGGGSHGSFGVAKAEQLASNDYDKFIGWSTGALIAPLAAINEFELLKKIYFNTNQKDVFNVNPFTKTGKVSVWNIIKRTLFLKPTLGETKALKKLIDDNFTFAHFNLIRAKGKEVIIATSCLDSKDLKPQYFSSNTCDFETFKTAMWASASPLFYGSIVDIKGSSFTDAGAVEILSFRKAIALGATYIDAVIHRTDPLPSMYISKVKRWWDFLGRVEPTLLNTGVSDAIIDGAALAMREGATVSLIYMQSEPDFTSFIFDPVKMTKLYYDSKK